MVTKPVLTSVLFQGHPGEEGPKGIQGTRVSSTSLRGMFPVFLLYC